MFVVCLVFVEAQGGCVGGLGVQAKPYGGRSVHRHSRQRPDVRRRVLLVLAPVVNVSVPFTGYNVRYYKYLGFGSCLNVYKCVFDVMYCNRGEMNERW